MGRLTATRVEALKRPGVHSDGDTLLLRISPKGSKYWIQRVTIHGKRRDLGIGPYPILSLQEARERAFENRKAVYHGRDVLHEKKERVAVPTFADAAKQYYHEHLPSWKDSDSSRRWLQVIDKYAVPAFGNRRVNQVTRQDVLRILTPIWTAKSEAARKLRQKVRLILQWSVSHGYTETNVAGEVLDGALPSMPHVKEHHRALPYQDVPEAMRTIEQSKSALSVRLCFEFLIMTATRSGEARGARWDEINVKEKVWIIPASRMKSPNEHRVPLSDAALVVLERARILDDGSGLIFPSPVKRGNALSGTTMTRFLSDNGLAEKAVTHGFRTSFRTWASECTNSDHAVMELCLAHRVGSQVEQAYSRSDLLQKRRALMQRWSDFLTAKQADVVTLHG